VHGVERKRRQGKRSTHVLYARVGVREFFKSDRRHPKLHVELPDGSMIEDVYFVIVANADPWTFVGNRALHPTPEATFDSGLAVYARRRMGLVGALYGMAGMARKHPRPPRWGARVVHDLERVTVIADEALPFQVDGDALETREKVTFRSVPKALSVVGVPTEIS
jgi:diacylglycerol kinase family enzyme